MTATSERTGAGAGPVDFGTYGHHGARRGPEPAQGEFARPGRDAV